MNNADLPATPIVNGSGSPHFAGDLPLYGNVCSGLTKREMFAMHAMQAMLSSRHVSDFNGSDADCNGELCSKAVGYADSLLEELSK